MSDSLKGKTALITGSSRGIGSAIAYELAQYGADIILHYIGNTVAAEKVKMSVESLGRQCCLVQADLCEPENISGLFEKVQETDILILNASVQYKKKWQEITTTDFYQQMTCNCLASMQLMQQAVPYMQRQHWGRIITIGSVQEVKPHPDMLVYSASKAAQTMMVKSLAKQLAGDGITVNNVAPGVIDTDRNTEALGDPVYAQTVKNLIPAGFFGSKEDCAGVVRLLCSESGRYITGQSIYVDGGKGL